MTPRSARQLTSPVQTAGRAPGLLLSATREIEPGARVMLIEAEGLFRLDARIAGDTLRVLVRNLSGAAVQMDDHHAGLEPHFVQGDVASHVPAQASVKFTLGGRTDQVAVEARLAILRFPDRGTLQITAQAVVRQPPAG